MSKHTTASLTVPARYRGVWQRTLLETPQQRDTDSTVFWMQTDLWHADIRIRAGRPDFSGVRSLADCSALQLAWLAGQQGFAGITQVESSSGREICTWHRQVDFQPPRATPDAGVMVFDRDVVTETGVHAPYLEHWKRLAGSGEHCLALQWLDEAGHPAKPASLLLMAGDYVMLVRNRSEDWPVDMPAESSLADSVGPGNTSLLCFDISFGVRANDGWIIRHSTLPWRENRFVRMHIGPTAHDRVVVSMDGCQQSWMVAGPLSTG